VQHLKMKYIDTVRWDGYVELKKMNLSVDSTQMTEEKVLRNLKPGKKMTLWGLGLTAIPVYSFGSGIAVSYLLTSVITISIFSYALLGLVPIGLTFLIIGIVKRKNAKKALLLS